MTRKVFYSFHYEPDSWRAAQIRNIGAIEGNRPAGDNDWEEVKKGGDPAIQRWIDSQMLGRSCAIVLIGSSTFGRKWINYEIIKAWTEKKGLLGIYVHNLKNSRGEQATRGLNPFGSPRFANTPIPQIVRAYEPPFQTSEYVYGYIAENIEKWIEEAISARTAYG